MIIALIGNDGSGKTTTSKELARVFQGLGFETIYKHEYDYVFLKHLLKLGGKKKIEESRKQMLEEKKKGLKFLAWPVLVWLDTLAQFYYYKIFKRNSIVILDRYPYDHYMSFEYLGYLTSFTKWLYLHFPKADATVLLWVAPEVAYNRKKETHSYAVTFYEDQTRKYLAFADQVRLKKVNTNSSFSFTIGSILEIVNDNVVFKRMIERRVLQNKVAFETSLPVVEKSKLTKLLHELEFRQERFKASIITLKKLMALAQVSQYAIFKDYADYKWIGNDLDVIISKSEVQKLLEILRKGLNGIPVEWKSSDVHSNGIEIRIEGLFNMDVHTAIGWRGIELFDFEELVRHIVTKEKFGVEYPALSNDFDALIYAHSGIFDKGFVTLLEYKIQEASRSNFAGLGAEIDLIESYEIFLDDVDPNRNFPMFIPLSQIIKGFRIRARNDKKSATILIRAARMVAMQLFWRIRYRLTSKLPFELEPVSDY